MRTILRLLRGTMLINDWLIIQIRTLLRWMLVNSWYNTTLSLAEGNCCLLSVQQIIDRRRKFTVYRQIIFLFRVSLTNSKSTWNSVLWRTKFHLYILPRVPVAANVRFYSDRRRERGGSGRIEAIRGIKLVRATTRSRWRRKWNLGRSFARWLHPAVRVRLEVSDFTADCVCVLPRHDRRQVQLAAWKSPWRQQRAERYDLCAR